MGDEDANAVGLYDESIFESSLYGGLNGLTTNRFQSLKKELNPEVESSGKKNTKFSPQKEDEKEQEENSLALKYPEFRALIERRGAENISEAELEQLRQKKQIAESYEANSTAISLEQEFSQAVFETNLRVWVFEGKFSFWDKF